MVPCELVAAAHAETTEVRVLQRQGGGRLDRRRGRPERTGAFVEIYLGRGEEVEILGFAMHQVESDEGRAAGEEEALCPLEKRREQVLL